MLCRECGGDGWKTVASGHQTVTLQCQVCDGTGICHSESPENTTLKAEAFWVVLDAAVNGEGHDYGSIRHDGLLL